ncbi:hypothetical protein CCP3SC1_2410001 [Gammaproteobacteria bacterium]
MHSHAERGNDVILQRWLNQESTMAMATVKWWLVKGLVGFGVVVALMLSSGCEDLVRGTGGGMDVGGGTETGGTHAFERVGSERLAVDGRRVALVIGNSAYHAMPSELQPLPNPVNDATDLAKALQRLGFQVTLRKDASLTQMDDSIYAFGQQINGGEVALVFYSGHGLQVKGENYLLPVDAKFEREDQIERQAIKAGAMLEKMGKAKTKLVFLDACRNNPFLSRGKRGSVGGGLAKMDTPDGTLLVYSTDPGGFADDGEGRNSPFTFNLLRHIADAGVDVQLMLRDVRVDVKRDTKNKQTPWDASSLEGAFYFIPPVVPAPAILVAPPLSTGTMTGTVLPQNNGRLAELEAKRIAEEARVAELEQKQREAEESTRLAEAEAKRKAYEARLADLEQRQRQATEEQARIAATPPPVTRKSFEPEMVSIPEGSFQMGSPSSEEGRSSDETRHGVSVGAFKMGKYSKATIK